MATIKSDVKQITVPVTLAADSAANWTSANPQLLKDQLCLERDTGKMKIGDGTKKWNELSYVPFSELTAAQITMLLNQNTANGVVVLGEDGKLNIDLLPDDLTQNVTIPAAFKWVQDIEERDALSDEDRKSIIFVWDATDDPTVTTGSAQYMWRITSGSGVESVEGEWVKVGEEESMDVDTSVFFHKTTDTSDNITQGTTNLFMTVEERTKLTNAFEKDTDTSDAITEGTINLFMTAQERTNLADAFLKGTDTADNITDGTTKVIMTAVERTKLGGIEEGADVTDAENVAAAGAIMYTDAIIINGPSAAQIAALYETEGVGD